MATINLSPDELLTTTRAVRKRLDLDREVPLELVTECVEIARQAPTGSNSQGWHFILVDDAEKRAGLADLYRQGWDRYLNAPGSLPDTISTHSENAGKEAKHNEQMKRVLSSAQYLADNLERVPMLMVPCMKGRNDQMTGPYANAVYAATYGSIIPATWNYMLAARVRGLGTAWTSAHLIYEQDAAELLGIPYAEFTQVALIPTAYYKGESFSPALRRPIAEVLHHNSW
ncbi:MAG: nitroreductase family protein [Gammaproteobacteria bacterium]|jgi:nitroreductase|nr:nitroreductase family protein [Gammaproteobacteria bacterium]MDP6616113.1 nitroreductase family protein [Gammaproteobacteria bacterium]MDP6694869.1 nitroreductase family protein [Gammaproteobacteria bacterium]